MSSWWCPSPCSTAARLPRHGGGRRQIDHRLRVRGASGAFRHRWRRRGSPRMGRTVLADARALLRRDAPGRNRRARPRNGDAEIRGDNGIGPWDIHEFNAGNAERRLLRRTSIRRWRTRRRTGMRWFSAARSAGSGSRTYRPSRISELSSRSSAAIPPPSRSRTRPSRHAGSRCVNTCSPRTRAGLPDTAELRLRPRPALQGTFPHWRTRAGERPSLSANASAGRFEEHDRDAACRPSLVVEISGRPGGHLRPEAFALGGCRLARHDVVRDPAYSRGCPRLVLEVQPP